VRSGDCFCIASEELLFIIRIWLSEDSCHWEDIQEECLLVLPYVFIVIHTTMSNTKTKIIVTFNLVFLLNLCINYVSIIDNINNEQHGNWKTTYPKVLQGEEFFKELPRMHKPTADEWFNRHDTRQPVIFTGKKVLFSLSVMKVTRVTGVMDNWIATEKWTNDYLKEKIPDITLGYREVEPHMGFHWPGILFVSLNCVNALVELSLT
jgi:hypothetical protein